MEEVPDPANYRAYVAATREAARRRAIGDVSSRLTAAASNGQDTASIDNLIDELRSAAQVRPLPQQFEVMTAREICELPDPLGEDELLGPLLVRRQRVLLGAHTGDGKTTMAMQFLKAATEKAQFLDWNGIGGKALVIDAEQGQRTVKRRLREAGLNESDAVDYLRVPDGLVLDKSDEQRAAIADLLARGAYDIVLAGPLYKLHGGDANAEREAVDLMKVFDRWREDYGFALVLEVHCRKPPVGVKFTMHEFFGSTAYLRGAEVVLGIQKIRPGFSKLHFFKDRDGDLPSGEAWGLLFDRETGFRRDPHDGEPKQKAPDKVQAALKLQPGLTCEQLMEITGLAERTVRDALKKLDARSDPGGGQTGQIKVWSLSEDGDEPA